MATDLTTAGAWLRLAIDARQRGNLTSASMLIDQAIAYDPAAAPCHAERSIVLASLGRLEEALAASDDALRLEPDLVEAHATRSLVLLILRRPQEALAAADEALRLRPDVADMHLTRGNILASLERLEEALGACDQALRLGPDLAEAHYNRGVVLMGLGRLDEALVAFDEALRLSPHFAMAQLNRGVVLNVLGRADEALAAYDEALRLSPQLFEAHLNRANLLLSMARLGAALAAFDEVLRLRPDFAQAHMDRGNALLHMGRLGEALAAYAEAVRLKPDYTEAHANHLFCLNFDPMQDDASLYEALRKWGERFGRSPSAFTIHRNLPDDDKTLRVGLVSPDLGRHPVGYFSESTLAALDRSRIELFGYSGRAMEDDVTARIKGHASIWRSTLGLSDRELAEVIVGDGVDVLIDLAGYTAASRITCFALRPAPVLVHSVGSTHSVPAVDYSLWDWVHVPEGAERWFVETVVRMPEVRVCYTPPDYAPEVADPPALAQREITFGSFNNLFKLNAGVLDLWVQVLTAVGGARLILSSRALADADARARATALFEARGICRERLDLRPGAPTHAGVLGEYGEVDIALDTFPFSGCTTTCEALWMGVPVVTLPQTRPVSRQSTSFLTALGRTEWIAKDAAEFVRIAATLAADPDHLARMRRAQRERMRVSPVCDAPRFARHLERALRDMWRAWCNTVREKAAAGDLVG